MSQWRALYLMWLCKLLMSALPENETGRRLTVALCGFLAEHLRTLNSPKAHAAADEFAALYAEALRHDVGIL